MINLYYFYFLGPEAVYGMPYVGSQYVWAGADVLIPQQCMTF